MGVRIATHTSSSLLTVVVVFVGRFRCLQIFCVGCKSALPEQIHLIGSFRQSRLPSRGKLLFTFYSVVLVSVYNLDSLSQRTSVV